MEINLKGTFEKIQNRIDSLTLNEFLLSQEDQVQHSKKVDNVIEGEIVGLPATLAQRVRAEFHGCGPLDVLMQDEDISEIIVNGPEHIWFEKSGHLHCHGDRFYSPTTFRNSVDRMCSQAQLQISVESPCADGRFGDFRLSLVGHELTQKNLHFNLRRHPKNPWTFEKLKTKNWCDQESLNILEDILTQRKNFLIIGPTGSGKTSILNSFLQMLPGNERVLAIEDTSEISLPNSSCIKLVTREDSQGLLSNIDQSQLVKRALRLRPDRIVMGEIRGSEAKDFLMALATGHTGSFGTLHAKDAQQALIRLEMLIQMGAPQWSLLAVRRLIQLSLDVVVVTTKTRSGERVLEGVFKINSLEDYGFILEQIEARAAHF